MAHPATSRSQVHKPRWIDRGLVLAALATAALEPLQLAFQETGAGRWTAVFADVLFLVALFADHRAQPELRKDKRRLGIDILANAPLDWIALMLVGQLEVGSVTLVALLRLNHLLRLERGVSILLLWGQSSRARTVGRRLALLSAFLLAVNHWVACGWFFLSRAAGHPPGSWVDQAGIQGLGMGEQYLWSLYWAVTTTTTVGYGDISPSLPHEMRFGIFVMLLGTVVHAILIGSVASALAGIDAGRTRFFKRVEFQVNFLRARGAPPVVIQRVSDYFDHLWEQHGGQLQDRLLADLPKSLRTEVLLELAGPLLSEVALFSDASQTLREALVASLRPEVHPPGAVLVRHGTTASEIFIVARGELEILDEEGSSHGVLEAGETFGLLSLTLGEMRTATVRANTYCDVFVLEASDFSRIKRDFPEFTEILKGAGAKRSARMAELLLDGIVL